MRLCTAEEVLRACASNCAAHKCNNFKGSIYMVFDYMDHDMTGLMERQSYKMPMDQVWIRRAAFPCFLCSILYHP